MTDRNRITRQMRPTYCYSLDVEHGEFLRQRGKEQERSASAYLRRLVAKAMNDERSNETTDDPAA